MKKWTLVFIASLSACATHQPTNGTAIDDMTVALHQGINANQALANDSRRNPGDLSKTLMPDFKHRAPLRVDYAQRRFDINVDNVPARAFYMGLVKDTPISMVVSPDMKGNITLSLKHVTVEQVLQALEDTYNYTYFRIPGGYEVLPPVLQTRIYSVNYLELQRRGNSDMRLHSGEVTEVVSGAGGGGGAASSSATSSQSSGGSGATSVQGTIGNVHTENKIDFWEELRRTLVELIGDPHVTSEVRTSTALEMRTDLTPDRKLYDRERSVTVNKLAGVVVVRAYPKELKQVEAYLDLVQNNMDRQVILEAKILEVTLNDKYQMGIDWQVFGLQLNSILDFPGTGITLADFPPAYTATVKWATDFTTTMRILGTQGTVQVLSSPRVATMNNQQSLIKVGNDEFFVSGIAPGQAVLGAVAQPSEVITPFFSGITLDVTPQIDKRGDVTLHVHPSVSLVTEQIKLLTVGTATPTPTPLAHSTIRESDTIVHAKNGQVVIIGGLMQNQTIEDIAELPFFGNIPFMGTLFRATKQSSQKSELVILIKATVVNKVTANNDLIAATQRLAGLKRGFHIGGRPDIFGTEGEEPIKLGPVAGDYVVPPTVRCRKGAPGCVRRVRPAPNLAEK
ncbi:secretin N-terminal domain-containing protein [bacterium]|nr:secretin N-terminal domain-containing protein [bacterium]